MAFKGLDQEKQSTIINAALEVFAKHGYKKASMGDISAVAGVSKSVLFKYFSTKGKLYETVFLLASRSLAEADKEAIVQGGGDADLFGLMRRSMKSRLSLLTRHPWVYEFSYTAFFDDDPFVQELVRKQSAEYLAEEGGRSADLGPPPIMAKYYEGLRKDISPADARNLILWVSTGYLKEKLARGDVDPEDLEVGYRTWIDIFETLLKDHSQ